MMKIVQQIRARLHHIVVGALLFGSIASAQSIDDDRTALARAKAQSILADQRAAELDAKADEELSAAEAAKTRAAAIAARIQSAEAEIAAAESRIRLIEKLQSDQSARLAAKQEPAVRLTAALQSLGRRPPALALVQPGSIDDLVHVRAILSTIIPILRARTAELRKEISVSQSLRRDSLRAVEALAGGKQHLATQRATLVNLAAQHRALSETTRGSAMAEQDRAMAMGEKARDIADFMQQLDVDAETRRRLASLPSPMLRPANPGDSNAPDNTEVASVSAKKLPYRLPVVGKIVTGLGEASEAGVRARGLTLSTREDAQIVAPNGGRIAFAGPYRGYGNIVIIDHGAGWTSLITSIAVLEVQTGDNVAQSGPIGRTGSDRPTITVELRHANKPVDIGAIVG